MLKTFLILIAILAITACGHDETDEIIGTWKGITGEAGIITFGIDERYIAIFGHETVRGTYLVSGNLLQIKRDHDDEIVSLTFSISGNVMTLEDESGDATILEKA